MSEAAWNFAQNPRIGRTSAQCSRGHRRTSGTAMSIAIEPVKARTRPAAATP